MPITYRVGAGSHHASELIRSEFGFDIDSLGSLSLDQARAIALQKQATKHQLTLTQKAVAHFEDIMELKKQIEELRLQVAKKGLKTRSQINELINKLDIELLKYNESLKTLGHRNVLEVQRVTQEGEAERGYYTTKFQQDLATALTTWREKATMQSATNQQEQTDRRLFLAYVDGKPVDPGAISGVKSRWGVA